MAAFKRIILFLSLLAIVSCTEHSSNQQLDGTGETSANKQSALTAETNLSNEIPTPCGKGGLALGDVVAVTDEYDLRTSPDSHAAKVKNEKASRILGTDQFHQIDNSTTVRRLCVQADWTKVQIQTPDWLTDVKGWVPNTALREIKRNKSGGRIYVEDDFLWDNDASPFKQQIVASVNKIAQENSNCGQIDTGSVAKSPSRSTPGDPVFFVTCGSGADAFNVWFKPNAAMSDKVLLAKKALGKTAAIDAWEVAAKRAAAHPSTVEFSRILDLTYVPHMSGRARVVSTFTAKNALNFELKYRIDCLFDGTSLIEANIGESVN